VVAVRPARRPGTPDAVLQAEEEGPLLLSD
jgi:hypothetical protein